MNLKPVAYMVVRQYTTPYPDSIVFNEGEPVTVMDEYQDDPDWVDWVWCEGKYENAAWVPKQYLLFDGEEWRLNRYYDAMELSIHPGEKLVVYGIVNGFGNAEKPDGTQGWVPMKNLQEESGMDG